MVDTWYENYEGEVITTSDFPHKRQLYYELAFPIVTKHWRTWRIHEGGVSLQPRYAP